MFFIWIKIIGFWFLYFLFFLIQKKVERTFSWITSFSYILYYLILIQVNLGNPFLLFLLITSIFYYNL